MPITIVIPSSLLASNTARRQRPARLTAYRESRSVLCSNDRPRGWYPRAPSTHVVRHGGPATCAGRHAVTAHVIFDVQRRPSAQIPTAPFAIAGVAGVLAPSLTATTCCAPDSRSRGRAATLVNADVAPGPDDLGKGGGGLGGDARSVVEIVQTSSVVERRWRGCSRRRSGSRRALATRSVAGCWIAPIRFTYMWRTGWPHQAFMCRWFVNVPWLLGIDVVRM